jgi:hypothetical protein
MIIHEYPSIGLEKRGAMYYYSANVNGSADCEIAHGVGDLLTLGLWEVVGAPVEAV